MPSNKPLIGVRLEPALYARVEAMAKAQDRSLANFVAHHLAVSLGTAVVPRQQLDLVDGLAGAVVRAVRRGPVSSKRPRR